MKKILLSLVVSFFILRLHSQIIPDSMRVDWLHAGYDGTIPDPQTILDVTGYGAIPNDTVADVASFSIGDYAELKETNGAWNSVPATWAVDCVGQIMKITNIIGDSLFLDEALRIDYTDSLEPQIRVFNPITNVGIECLKIA